MLPVVSADRREYLRRVCRSPGLTGGLVFTLPALTPSAPESGSSLQLSCQCSEQISNKCRLYIKRLVLRGGSLLCATILNQSLRSWENWPNPDYPPGG